MPVITKKTIRTIQRENHFRICPKDQISPKIRIKCNLFFIKTNTLHNFYFTSILTYHYNHSSHFTANQERQHLKKHRGKNSRNHLKIQLSQEKYLVNYVVAVKHLMKTLTIKSQGVTISQKTSSARKFEKKNSITLYKKRLTFFSVLLKTSSPRTPIV